MKTQKCECFFFNPVKLRFVINKRSGKTNKNTGRDSFSNLLSVLARQAWVETCLVGDTVIVAVTTLHVIAFGGEVTAHKAECAAVEHIQGIHFS